MSNSYGISYLDAASTTKIDPRVLDVMLPFFSEYYGNASSAHIFGQIAMQAIEKARNQVGKIINGHMQDIIFTSGATESINFALKGYVESNYEQGNHIITAQTEHKAVLETCKYLETKGVEVTYLRVDKNGLISIDKLRDSIKKDTILITIMYVNNETGVIQPIKQIGELAKENNIALFCDATQAVGKISINVENDNIDMLCFSGHKLNGPKGIGVLYKRNNIELTPLIHGGSQEKGQRSGTYNTPLIVGLGKACELTYNEMTENINVLTILNKYLLKSVAEITQLIEITPEHLRVPNIINIIIPGLESDLFIDKYKSISVSNGSACTSLLMEESHVFKAMFPDKDFTNHHLRISLDNNTTKEDINEFIKVLKIHLKINPSKLCLTK